MAHNTFHVPIAGTSGGRGLPRGREQVADLYE
jgi:hypothetical protein